MGGVVPLVKFLEQQKLRRVEDELLAVDATTRAGDGMAVQLDHVATGAEAGAVELEPACESTGDADCVARFTQAEIGAAYERGRQEAVDDVDRRLKGVAEQVQAAVDRAVEHTANQLVGLCAGIVDQLGQRHLLQHLLERVSSDVAACIAGSALRSASVSGDPELARLVAEKLREGGIEVEEASSEPAASLPDGSCRLEVGETVLEVRLDEWLRDLKAVLQ